MMVRAVLFEILYVIQRSLLHFLSTVWLSSLEQSPPALHLQHTVHGNLVWQQLHLVVLQLLLPSEQLYQIRDIISSGARATPTDTLNGSKD